MIHDVMNPGSRQFDLKPLPWKASVADVIACWPADRALTGLVSAGDSPAWSRWSLLASPVDVITSTAEAARTLTMQPRAAQPQHHEHPPFRAGWIGWIGYEAGERIEPAARRAAVDPLDDRRWPEVCLHRCDGVYAFDHVARQWWVAGDEHSLPRVSPSDAIKCGRPEFHIGEPVSGVSELVFTQRVRRVLDYIRAGDVFQANISRRLSAEFSGSIRALFLELIDAMAPWFGALIEGPAPGRSVLSLSPELFLKVDAGGRITTRPIKGTAPAGDAAARLVSSEKDQAELAMIVDLMRNDLGRVCEFGSIRVSEARAIEAHGSTIGAGVWHGVATVEGVARQGVSVADILNATFPPGSVTGAPKVRAMQIIRELEPVRRGPYCGSVGWIDESGAAMFNVAIRTAVVSGDAPDAQWDCVDGVLDYHVGAGIVSDSDPHLEWRETEAKAAGFLRAIERRRAVPSGAMP